MATRLFGSWGNWLLQLLMSNGHEYWMMNLIIRIDFPFWIKFRDNNRITVSKIENSFPLSKSFYLNDNAWQLKRFIKHTNVKHVYWRHLLIVAGSCCDRFSNMECEHLKVCSKTCSLSFPCLQDLTTEFKWVVCFQIKTFYF